MMRLPPSVLLERLRERFRERGTAFVLALAIEILIVLLLIFMAPTLPGIDKGKSPNVFGIDLGSSDDAQEATPQKQQKQQAKSGKPQPTPPKPVEPPPQDKPPLPEPPVELPPNFLRMTRAEYRAADIAGKGREPSAATDSGEAAVAKSGSSGRMPGDSDVVGKAPNGEPLYAAEWYRRPTQAELSAYLPRGWASEGVGVVACRTVARYHVEDCKLLAQSPPGAGYGNAVLQSAWQFLVRPPRVGGKEMVGSWVSIKIDYLVVRK